MSRKLTITLVLILFLLPFGSWYYLRSGLQWRKAAQAYMNGTEAFPRDNWIQENGKPFLEEQWLDHVSLVMFAGCTQDAEEAGFIKEVYHQFKETGKANFIAVDTCREGSEIPSELQVDFIRLDAQRSVSPAATLKSKWKPDAQFALVDRNGILRSYYMVHTKEEKKQLLEHMALLIPREHAEKVELKRNAKPAQ